eukprot:54618_1
MEFLRQIASESDDVLMQILDDALVHNNLEIPSEIQREILHFIPFFQVSDAASLIISLESYPMERPNMERTDIIQNTMKDPTARKRICVRLDTLLSSSISKCQRTMHRWYYYLAAYAYKMEHGTDALTKRAESIYCVLKPLLRIELIADHKDFVVCLLSYWHQNKEQELKDIAASSLNILGITYQTLYQTLLDEASPILALEIPSECLCDRSIKSQREVMGIEMRNDLLNWYNAKRDVRPKGYVHAEDEQTVKSFFDGVGLLKHWNEVEKVARITKKKFSLLRKSDVAMVFYKLIAESINDDFQDSMYKLYEKNRVDVLQLEMPPYNPLCQLMSAPIKTISRAKFKIKEDYNRDEEPQAGSILDWVRCAIVVESDTECASLVSLVLETYKGCVVAVKNKFDSNEYPNEDYRAVMISIVWNGDCGLRMIVEVQIILSSYLPIRRKSHLWYKMHRSRDWRAMAEDFAKFAD